MSDKRQKIQPRLAFGEESRGEAPKAPGQGSEASTAKRMNESQANNDEQLMEEVCERENCLRALKRVRSNKGSPGIDGMTVEELPGYLKEHWPAIREQLLAGTYMPQPVKRVAIPKPDGGGMRNLGIPTVLDRMVQQAVQQVLQNRWDADFSEHSYGFRPGRSAHQAVAKAQQYVAEGRRWVVDLDLEKFFDRVNHDKLMASIAGRVVDKRMLKLIRAFLTAGVMENGLVGSVDEGTPQGQAADRREGGGTVQAEGTGAYGPDAGHQYRANDEGPVQLFTWLEELLRLLRDALGAERTGSMDAA